MEQPRSRLARRTERRVAQKGLRPRFAVSLIAAVWVIGIVVFGVVERLIDAETFDNVWIAMWWATQTVTTVGYGDVVPAQTAGKVIGAFLMIGGLALFAVITGVVTSAFVTQAQAARHPDESHAMRQELEEMTRRLSAIEAKLAGLPPASE